MNVNKCVGLCVYVCVHARVRAHSLKDKTFKSLLKIHVDFYWNYEDIIGSNQNQDLK